LRPKKLTPLFPLSITKLLDWVFLEKEDQIMPFNREGEPFVGGTLKGAFKGNCAKYSVARPLY